MTTDTTPFFVQIPNRGLIHIEGEERYEFLQNIITNDIEELKSKGSLYACLLTAHGKFLHDFFLMQGEDFILIDCEGGARAKDLFGRLMMFRLRAKVKISIEDDVPVYAVFGQSPAPGFHDPRSAALGWRTYNTKPDISDEKPFAFWDTIRIKNGIPDGSRDMIIEQSNLIECNIDQIGGVSFTKGCYVGQELTARLHNRGLSKKHLYTVQLPQDHPEENNTIEIDERYVGDLRSRQGNLALAVIKDAEIEKLGQTTIKLLD